MMSFSSIRTLFSDQLAATALVYVILNNTLKSYVLWKSTRKPLLILEHIWSLWDLKWAYCSCQKISIYGLQTRSVHGSVQVRFVPNSELTRPDRMVGITTCHQAVWLIRSGRLDIQRRAVSSVGVGDLKIDQNPAF